MTRPVGAGAVLVGASLLSFPPVFAQGTPRGASENRSVPTSEQTEQGAKAPNVEDQFEWSSPVGCVEEQELAQGISRTVRLERMHPRRRVVGSLLRAAGTYRAVLLVEEDGKPVGRRVLDFPVEDCREIDDSVELVVAMLLEGGLRQEEREAFAEEQRQVREEEKQAEDAARQAVEPVEGEVRLVQGTVALQPLFVWTASANLEVMPGIAPPVGWGPRLEVGGWFRLPVWVGLYGSFFPWAAQASPAGEGRVELSTYRLGLRGCAVLWELEEALAVRLDGCLGAGAIIQSARGRDFATNNQVTWSTMDVHAAARWSGRLHGKLRWQAGAGLVLPLRHAEYFASGTAATPSPQPDEQEVFATAPVLGAFTVGVEATF